MTSLKSPPKKITNHSISHEKSTNTKENILKMPNEKLHSIEKFSEKKQADIDGLINAIGASGLDEFIEYIRSPWKMLWPNFVAGVARGFGALVGAAVVIALIGWFLSTLIDIPLIGKKLEPYVHVVQDEVKKYTDATNYRDKFDAIQNTLQDIHIEIKKQNTEKDADTFTGADSLDPKI